MSADIAAALTAAGAGRGSDPSLLVDELLWYIEEDIRRHPRSLQKAIGPSEIGHPCARRIGYKMLGAPTFNSSGPTPWLPTIGTATHAWLERALSHARTSNRFLTEMRVTIGDVGGAPVTGSCDVYDTITATVIDWKIVGATALRRVKANGPGQQYLSQIHGYGRGIVAAGHPVDRVMIAFLPRNEELRTDSYFWHEPYDEQVALKALQRADGIAWATRTLGRDAVPLLPTADAYCHRCSYFRAGSTDPTQGCPGDPESRPTPPLTPPSGPAFGPVQERLITA